MADWPPISPIPTIPVSSFIAWVRHQYPPSCSTMFAWTVQGIRSSSFDFGTMCNFYLNLHLSAAYQKVCGSFRDIRFVQCFYNDGLITRSYIFGGLSTNPVRPGLYISPQLCPCIRKEAHLFPGRIVGHSWLPSLPKQYWVNDRYSATAQAVYANFCNVILAGWSAYDLLMLPAIWQQSTNSVFPIQNIFLLPKPSTRYSRRARELKAHPWPSYPVVT